MNKIKLATLLRSWADKLYTPREFNFSVSFKMSGRNTPMACGDSLQIEDGDKFKLSMESNRSVVVMDGDIVELTGTITSQSHRLNRISGVNRDV